MSYSIHLLITDRQIKSQVAWTPTITHHHSPNKNGLEFGSHSSNVCFYAFEVKSHWLDPGLLTSCELRTSCESGQLGKVKLQCARQLNTTSTKSCKAILLPDPSPCFLSLNLTDLRGKGRPRDLDRETWRDRVE